MWHRRALEAFEAVSGKGHWKSAMHTRPWELGVSQVCPQASPPCAARQSRTGSWHAKQRTSFAVMQPSRGARGLELLVACCSRNAPLKSALAPRTRRKAPAKGAPGTPACATRRSRCPLEGAGGAPERLVTCLHSISFHQPRLEPLQPAAQDPSQEKFRRIRLGNAAFQARVGSLEGGVAALELLGFAREAADDVLVLPAEKVRDTSLCAAHPGRQAVFARIAHTACLLDVPADGELLHWLRALLCCLGCALLPVNPGPVTRSVPAT